MVKAKGGIDTSKVLVAGVAFVVGCLVTAGMLYQFYGNSAGASYLGRTPGNAMVSSLSLYGGLLDATNTPTNISLTGSIGTSSSSFTASAVLLKKMVLSMSGSNFEEVATNHYLATGTTFTGWSFADGTPKPTSARFEISFTKQLAPDWGCYGIRITNLQTKAIIYTTGSNPDGTVKELPMYSSNQQLH